jgi:undecaprenyl diphosphate synthase
VDLLMRLLVKSLKKELPTFIENNVRLGAIGSLEALPGSAQNELKEVIEATSQHTGMTLTLALSYGAREELTQAMRQIADKVKNNIIKPEDIDQACINTHLYTCDLPDVDLLIRTSGEQRISNFLLWQIAYAELYFTEVFWPEFDENALENAFLSYQHRERRFGKTSEQVQS